MGHRCTGTGSENLVFGTGTLNLAKFRVYREFTPYRSRRIAETDPRQAAEISTGRLWDSRAAASGDMAVNERGHLGDFL